MGQISTGVGLISGLPIADIIDQLIAIESRPKQFVESRIAVLQSQQVAFQDINAKLLALKLRGDTLSAIGTFRGTQAASSNESILTATSSSGATPGSYTFISDRLVSTQQMISQGFVDSDTTPIGAGTLTFEFGDARLDIDTDLSALNGGTGTTRGKVRITDRSGASAVVDLSRALTVDDVLNEINNSVGISVTARVVDDRFELEDTSGSTTTNLSVSDLGATGTTASLGLDAAAVGNTLSGNQANLVNSDTLLSFLNDGHGVDINDSIPGHIRFQRRAGDTVDIDLAGAATLGEVVDAINTQAAGAVTASINAANTGLDLVDNGPDLGSTFEVQSLNGSNAASDLGILLTDDDNDGAIAGRRSIATINSKLVRNLNGGSGANLGQILITNRSAVPTAVDLSSADSVAEVLQLINASGADVTASLNQAGNGILLTDQTGDTASDLIVADVTGTGAVDLNIAGSFTADEVNSGSLQYRYITDQTLLASLNGGQGISRGKFSITDSSGVSATVDLSQGNETRVQDVLDEINSRGLLINARINDNGDGILIEDLGPGTVNLKVQESGSTTAADLGLKGEAENPGDDLNGSFEKTVTIEATDTLEDVATKINDAGIDVVGTVINDGSALTPYRLSLTSKKAGTAGAFVFDDGGLDFAAVTLSSARDAVAFFGSADPASGIAIRSTTNTLNDVVPGATIDLRGTGADPATVTISRDDAAITEAVQGFVDDFNSVVDTLNTYDTYDAETQRRGLLLGDSTVGLVRNSIFRLANSVSTDLSGQFTNLAQVGVTIGTGAKMSFNPARFAAALQSDRNAVEALFTFKETETDEVTGETVISAAGVGARIDELLETLTDSATGTLQSRLDSMDQQIQLSNRRIEQLDDQLDSKRARLEAQFVAMERSLAQIQGQSNALTSLQGLAISLSSSLGSGGQ